MVTRWQQESRIKAKRKWSIAPQLFANPYHYKYHQGKQKEGGEKEEEVVKVPNPQPERRKEGGIGDD